MLAAESVSRTGNGRYNIAGEFGTFGAPQFPAAHPSFWVTARILFHDDELAQDRMIECLLVHDTVERPLVQFASIVAPAFPAADPSNADPGAPPRQHQLDARWHVMSVVFPEAGRYSLRVLVDGEEVGRRRLTVQLVPEVARE